MRLWPLMLASAILYLGMNQTEAAGFRFIEIPAQRDMPALKGAVWYPSVQPPQNLTIGPYQLSVAKDGQIQGSKLPLVVISHGWSGSYLGHRDTAEALANAGFVVAAINHADSAQNPRRNGDLSVLLERPGDIRRTVDYMLGSWPDASKLDASRIGFFGFSRGGYTGLVALGAKPDFKPDICQGKDSPACRQAHEGKPRTSAPRIKAAVIADPLAIFFNANSFANVKAPVQLWASEQGGDGVAPGSVAAIAKVMPANAEFHTVPHAQHFAFLPPCPAALASQAPEICTDAPGFDRAAFHRELNAKALTFFRKQLVLTQ